MTENKRYEFDEMNGGGYVVGYSERIDDISSFFTRLCEVPTKKQAEKVCNELKGLQKENEQLKETINELRDMDKEKDIEIEHINNIYKEFGFKGIIDYAKDKLQNYGAVREVDNGLWLLATGGWSDNEFWLDCLLNWNFMYAKGYYRATTSGGGYYYSETPYEDIEIKKRQIKG